MTSKNNNFRPPDNKKPRQRLLFRRIIQILFISASIIFISYIWIIPALIRWKIEIRLSEICGGPVQAGRLRIDLSRHVFLDAVSIYDKSGQEWLSAGKINVTLAEWPALRPTIQEVLIDSLGLQLSSIDGKMNLPQLNLPLRSDEVQQDSITRKITIKKALVSITDGQGSQGILGNLSFSAGGANNVYEFQLNQNRSEDPGILSAGGSVNFAEENFDFTLQINRRFITTETKAVFMALNMPEISAECRISANLTATGSLSKPAEFQSDGRIELSDCSVFFQKGILANDLAFTVRLEGQRLDVNDFAATVCDGPVIGQFHAEVKDSRSIEYQGQILATEVNYPKFTSTFGTNSAGTAGSSFSGSYGFAGRNDDPNALHGEGMVLLNDTDISVLPVIAAIFEFIGLSRIEPLKISDAEAKFHNTGSLVTIESGHISNLFAAIEFEPGGTLDLNTKQIDAYVVAAPLNQITDLIKHLPVIEIFANLKEKLMRIHIKGHWSDPPEKLIKKEPIKDLKESTVGFMRDVTKTGGQFGQGMVDRLSNLLKPKNKENE